MKLRLSDLWRWDGTIDRGPYVVWGLGLTLIKYNLDRLAMRAATGKSWWPTHYWIPGDVFGVLSTDPTRASLYLPLLAIAIPFLYVGVVLTLRRLRAAGVTPWCVLVFVVPMVNLLFFLLMSALPSREPRPAAGGERRSFLDRLIPEDPLGSAAMAVGLVVPLSALLVLLAVAGLGSYGWGVFLGLPFALGLTASLLHGYRRPRSFGSCLVVSCVALLLLGGVLVAVAAEGLICIAMAAPILFALTLIGAGVGYAIQGPVGRTRSAPPVAGLLLVALPMLMGAESACPPPEEILEVRTAVEIDAPPERVWRHVVEFSELPPPDEWLFRRGIAYPQRARIYGRGPGAVRHCVFSTGAFVEPIEVWDEPRLLKFSVTSSPPAMEEWTLWAGARPPHVDDSLVSKRGQFRLEPLPGGRTRLEGTTWYTHRIWPEAYWREWSDAIIGKIHARVLRHIQRLAEQR